MKIKINAQIFYDEEGNKVGVKLKLKEFEALMEKLEDALDVYTANLRTQKKGKTISFEKIKKELFADDKK
jgi:hypothetical protein